MSWTTIVVGTDGSERAGRAVAHAGALAGAVGAELIVVTAYAAHPDREPGEAVPAELEWATTAAADAQETAGQGAQLARGAGAGRVRALSLAGDPSEVLRTVARDNQAGLVVIGSRGMRSATRFVVGSVANEVTHRSDRDVLVVRTD